MERGTPGGEGGGFAGKNSVRKKKKSWRWGGEKFCANLKMYEKRNWRWEGWRRS